MSHRENDADAPRFSPASATLPAIGPRLRSSPSSSACAGSWAFPTSRVKAGVPFDALTTVLLCIAASVAAAIVIVACERGFTRPFLTDRPCSRLARLTPAWSWRSIALFSGDHGAVLAPLAYRQLPGGMYWDTYYQIFQCYPENHPIAVIPYAGML